MADGERGPTQFGFYLLKRMTEKGMHRQLDLVKATGISAATVSRLTYSDEYTPDVRTLQRLGDALDVPVTDLVARWTGGVRHGGRGAIPPTLVELASLIEDDSLLTAEERDRLETILQALTDTYRGIVAPRWAQRAAEAG
ncbi:helix-turn-helix domain-containing protein [Dactylosporangium sp. CA-139066]|uniref:helix-turn-helix domain-containing protein n=1 Tax=Dactylosporangium sp. CA-139066 TaxID=3239930 RepID=UPI003D940006